MYKYEECRGSKFDIRKKTNDFMIMRFITNVCLMRPCDTLANDPNQGPASISWTRHRNAQASSYNTEYNPEFPRRDHHRPVSCVTRRGPGSGIIIAISGDLIQSRARPRLPIMCPACPACNIVWET